ncbi:unnamed protein product [Kuraishia capsulata CBS 1993]|uniref:Arrestin C-terminal-like domain-containing protein n=1 Tax=Kuraishia capsulata CBS 1993 TaxID=1382522 RepID=W6MWS1_9ASCO|nr:uncharacterized protein KUCA_T00003779001 [Kuraishia capsulata CBS 1993]CDK27800.1 unnamed protein product [Kuraishia capsulata CBS 1993]
MSFFFGKSSSPTATGNSYFPSADLSSQFKSGNPPFSVTESSSRSTQKTLSSSDAHAASSISLPSGPSGDLRSLRADTVSGKKPAFFVPGATDANSATFSSDFRPNLKSYNEKLVAYLTSQGLNINPLKLSEEKTSASSRFLGFHKASDHSLQAFISGNGPILFLPHAPTKKKTEAGASEDPDDDDEISRAPTPSLPGADISTTAADQQEEVDRVTHTFAVILKLSKPHSLQYTAHARFETVVSNQWPQGVPHPGKNGKTKMVNREDYKVAKDLHWDLDIRNCDCFIAFKNHKDDNEDEDLHFHFQETDSVTTSSTSDSGSIVVSKEPMQKIRYFEMLQPDDFEEYDPESEERNQSSGTAPGSGRIFNPGYYIFIMPVLFPINMPESILTPLAQVQHHFTLQLERLALPALQPPAAVFLSTSPHRLSNNFDDLEPSLSPVTSNMSTGGGGSSIFASLSPKTSGSFLKSLGNHNTAPKRKLSMRSKQPTGNSSLLSYNYRLPIIRLPPSDSATTLNKSIYVNKVWNDAMNYEILFPKKYVQLSPASGVADDIMRPSTFNLQVKIIPLIKTLSVKRVKVNILEKITYISQDQKYEVDVGKTDSSGIKERTITLFEVKTKEKGPSTALKTEIIKGCVNDNLLTSCFNNGHLNRQPTSQQPTHRNRSHSNSFFSHGNNNSSSSTNVIKSNAPDDIVITNPVKITSPLVFQAADDFDFIKDLHQNIIESRTDIADLVEEDENGEELTSIFSNGSQTNLSPQASNNSAVIDDELDTGGSTLRSIFSKSSLVKSPILGEIVGNTSRKSSFGANTVPKNSHKNSGAPDSGLYPDCSFHNVKIRHRLQICFRISKPEDKRPENGDPVKMHHYEVIVDTPLVLVSPFCVGESIELPSYDSVIQGPPKFSIGVANAVDYESGEIIFDNDQPERLPSFNEAVLQPASPMMSTGIMMNRLHDSATSMFSDDSVNSTTLLSASPLSINASSPSAFPSSLNSYDLARRDRNNTVDFNNIDALMANSDQPYSRSARGSYGTSLPGAGTNSKESESAATVSSALLGLSLDDQTREVSAPMRIQKEPVTPRPPTLEKRQSGQLTNMFKPPPVFGSELTPSVTTQSDSSVGTRTQDEPPSYQVAVTDGDEKNNLKKSLLDDQDDENNMDSIEYSGGSGTRALYPTEHRLGSNESLYGPGEGILMEDDVQTLSGLEPTSYGSVPLRATQAFHVLNN